MNYPLIFLLLIIDIAVPLAGQQKPAGLKVYIFSGRYSEGVRKYLEAHNYPRVRMIPQMMIDANNDLIIEKDSVRKQVAFLFPEKNDTGLCTIDWEGKAFKGLIKEANTKDFQLAEARFLELISMIRELRPRIRVGIYALPFRVFHTSQLKRNAGNKLDRILSKCDFIAPSLYIMYPDQQIGESRNIEYLKQNLDISFEYAQRLNKPVIPFVWYKVHPGNKLFGNNIVSRQEMENYLTFISRYRYQGKGVEGVIWWEAARRRVNAKQGARAFAAQPEASDPDSILVQYTRPFIDK